MLLSFSGLAQEQLKSSIPFSHLHCVRSIKCPSNLKVCANFNFCVYLLYLTGAKEYCLPLLIYIVHLLLNVFKKCDELKPGEPSSPTTRKSLYFYSLYLLTMSSLSSYSYVFFLWANLFGTSGPFVCPSISLLQIFIFKFLIKSPAI